MPYETRRVLTRMSITAPLLLVSAACVSGPALLATPSACSSLLPAEWLAGVDAPPIPEGVTVGDWIAFSDAAVGQLDKANDRYRAGVGIVGRCEERDRKALKDSRAKFLGLF